MILEGDTSVIDALKEKKRLMDAGEEHGHIRPLLFCGGGFMKGAYGLGALQALSQNDYHNVFTTVVGVSSGTPGTAYFLANDIGRGGTIMTEECASDRFLKFSLSKNICDTGYLEQVLRGVTGKGLNTAAVLAHQTKYLIAVTEYDTAALRLYEPQSEADLFTAIRASVSMPNGVLEPIYIDGVRYVDGGFGSPHAIAKVMQETNATHVLVLANQDKDTKDILFTEKLLDWTLWRNRMTPALRASAHRRRKARHQVVSDILETKPKPFLIDWGNASVGNFERDMQKVHAATTASKAFWHTKLS